MPNLHTAVWTNPGTREDGEVYGQANNAGYEIGFDGLAAVSIPLAWGTTFDLSTLAAFKALKTGTHTLQLSAVDTTGIVGDPGSATFQYSSPPMAPTGVSVN